MSLHLRIHEIFEAQAARTPGDIAVVFGDRALTYQEINERANRLGHFLRTLGIGPDSLVGICMERSFELIIGILGILKAGGAYLPLDLAYPSERLAFMLRDTDCRAVITAGPAPSMLGLGEERTVVDLSDELLTPYSPSNIEQPGGAGDLAYVMYTSGSTGHPKGVMIPHRAVVNLVWNQHYVHFGSRERILALAPVSFDASTFELWAPLLHGGVCVLGPSAMPSLSELENLIRNERITCIFLTTGLFNQIVDARPSLLAEVAHVLTGGEAMSAAHLEKALQVLPATRLTNVYGPTESTTFTCFYDIRRDHRFAARSVPIGQPIADVSCHILDAHLNPVPLGTDGELYIGGKGLARGYLNQPDLTAEKFVQHGSSDNAAATLFRSGDRCRRLPDGNIEYLGRLDDQVKVRGFRVELGEVESALLRLGDVENAAVVTRRAPGGVQELAAYVVAKPGSLVSAPALQQALRSWLPYYMLPASITLTGSLPLTLNGKVDRRALQKRTVESVMATTQPDTAMEAKLSAIWAQVLERKVVGIHEDFFDIGGHSLLAFRLISEVERELGRDLPLALLFTSPTIASMAKHLDQVQLSEPLSGGLRGASTRAPLFHIPGWRFFGFLPSPVARRIGTVRRFFDGLQYPGIDGKQAAFTRVEDFAAHLIPQIRRVCPRGPYCLSGHSFGGVIAFELARQLRAEGEQIELLLLWDSFLPSFFRRRTTPEFLLTASKHLLDLQAQNAKARYIAYRARRAVQKLSHLGSNLYRRSLGRPTRAETLSSRAEPEFDSELRQVMSNAVVQALDNYRPRPYDGKVVLFRVAHPQGFRFELNPPNGWDALVTGGFEVVHVPGTHLGIVHQPAVSTLAEKMYAYLAK